MEAKGNVDYRATLQLPRTDFPMRASLSKREPEFLQRWEEERLYERLQQLGKEQNRPVFILHDGPPYANGDIHIGTAFNKILKDIVIRSHSHGRLPCAVRARAGIRTACPSSTRSFRRQKIDRHAMDPVEFRRLCRDYALNFVDIHREQFRRLGVWGDWDNPYLTLHPHYEARADRSVRRNGPARLHLSRAKAGVLVRPL